MHISDAPRASSQVLSGVIKRDRIEDMAAAVRSFFDLEATQLEPGDCSCHLDFVAAGGVFAYHEHYALRMHLTGGLLGGRFGFALPVDGPPIKFAGEEMDLCRLASAMTGEEMDVHAQGGLKQIVVLMDQARILELAAEAGLPREVQRALSPGRSTMPLVAKPEAVEDLGHRVHALLRDAAAGKFPMDQAGFEEWIYGQVLSLVDVRDLPCGSPPAAVLVRRAMEIADEHRGPVPVATLCSLLKVSPGTLEKSFKKITGVGPHAFFLRRRLNRARSQLLAADPFEHRVTDVAADLGFHELGRFAVRYRQMFGETPSQTLRRRVSVPVAVGR